MSVLEVVFFSRVVVMVVVWVVMIFRVEGFLVCVFCDEVVEFVLSSCCYNERKRGEGFGSRLGSKMLSYI